MLVRVRVFERKVNMFENLDKDQGVSNIQSFLLLGIIEGQQYRNVFMEYLDRMILGVVFFRNFRVVFCELEKSTILFVRELIWGSFEFVIRR